MLQGCVFPLIPRLEKKVVLLELAVQPARVVQAEANPSPGVAAQRSFG